MADSLACRVAPGGKPPGATRQGCSRKNVVKAGLLDINGRGAEDENGSKYRHGY